MATAQQIYNTVLGSIVRQRFAEAQQQQALLAQEKQQASAQGVAQTAQESAQNRAATQQWMQAPARYEQQLGEQQFRGEQAEANRGLRREALQQGEEEFALRLAQEEQQTEQRRAEEQAEAQRWQQEFGLDVEKARTQRMQTGAFARQTRVAAEKQELANKKFEYDRQMAPFMQRLVGLTKEKQQLVKQLKSKAMSLPDPSDPTGQKRVLQLAQQDPYIIDRLNSLDMEIQGEHQFVDEASREIANQLGLPMPEMQRQELEGPPAPAYPQPYATGAAPAGQPAQPAAGPAATEAEPPGLAIIRAKRQAMGE